MLLGLAFEARDPATDRRATYDIDTDLYDISQDKQRAFAEEIEGDILEFLDNLRARVVLRGTDGPKFTLVFLLIGSHVRVVQGRFMSSASTHADLAAARTGGDYWNDDLADWSLCLPVSPAATVEAGAENTGRPHLRQVASAK